MFTSPGDRSGRWRGAAKPYQRETPAAAGFTFYCRDEVDLLLLDGTGAFGSGTVYLPRNPPQDGERLVISSSFAVVALTVSAINGTVVNPPGSIGCGGRIEFLWAAPSNSWVCIDGYVGRLFKPPKVADFTSINPQSNTYADGPSALEVIAPAAGNQLAMLVKAAPAAPYTLAMTWRTGLQEWGSGSIGIGLCLRNSSAGRMYSVLDQMISGAGTHGMGMYRWTSPTVVNATVQTANSSSSIQGIRLDVTSTQAVVNFGDVGGFNWRATGFGTTEVFSTFMTAAGGAVDQIGLCFYLNNNWATYQIETFGTWS